MVVQADRVVSYLSSVESSLDFVFASGGVTPVDKHHTTGWRTLPWLLTAYSEGGTASFSTPSAPRRDIGDGQVLCVAPGVPHCITRIEAGVSWWSHISFKLAGGLPLTNFIEIPQIISGECATRIMQINGELARNADVRRQDLESLCRRKALGFELASVVASLATIRQERSGIFYGAERLQSVLRYIEGHIDGDLSRTRLAYILSLSPSRFYAVFEAALGVGPNAYVQQRRMERAQQLLITTSLSVSEVGRACGYEDQFVFSRIFKKLFGLSPLQYRRQIQQDYGNA